MFFSIVLLIVTLLGLWTAGTTYFLCGKRKWRGCLLVTLAGDSFLGWFFLSTAHWRPGIGSQESFYFRLLAMLLMFQLVLNLLVTISLCLRFIYRRILHTPTDPSRRRFLKAAVAYPAAAATLSVYGGETERKHAVDREFTIPFPAAVQAKGVRIAQISDIHLGAFFSTDDFSALLARISKQGADALMVTGDLFDDPSQNEQAAAILSHFVPHFPKGIYFVMGNHEYYRGGLAMVQRILKSTGVHFLSNSAIPMPDTDLWVAGVDFSFLRGSAYDTQRKEYLDEAMAHVPDPQKTLLLAHHPDFMDEAAAIGIPLTLSGHTHGSQLGFLGQPLIPVFKYTRGLFRHGASYGYVHCGNGSWFPFRLGCPPEIAYFTIT